MKVIILSAGIGSRLNPLTKNIPKSMLLIDRDTTVLERTINMVNDIIDTEIVIVAGFCKNQIENLISKYDNCKLIYNPFYRITNSITSLWFAKDEMDNDLLIINGDVILEKELLIKSINLKEDAVVLYDSSKYENADYKVSQQNGEVVVMSKELREFSGEYVGITKLNKEESNKLKNKIENMIDNELYNEWYETALVDMIFTENFKLKAIDVCGYEWTEIDNVNDLVKARQIFNFDKFR